MRVVPFVVPKGRGCRRKRLEKPPAKVETAPSKSRASFESLDTISTLIEEGWAALL